MSRNSEASRTWTGCPVIWEIGRSDGAHARAIAILLRFRLNGGLLHPCDDALLARFA
jgi:hypothetical protein